MRRTAYCLIVIWITLDHCAITCAASPTATPLGSDHADLSYYSSPDGTRRPIVAPADWQHRRRQILAGMEQAMGPLPRPETPTPLSAKTVEENKTNGLIRRKLVYHTDRSDQTVSAWLLLPAKRAPEARRAALLCLHQTTPNGKDSPVGLSDRPSMHYAIELARRGYVTLSPDYPSFGEHAHDFDADSYVSGSMKAIYDNIRAIDLLQSLPEVDPNRIGCIGHSLGGHNALFTAVFEPRIKAVATSCGFTSFHKYMNGDLRGWSGPRYMPRIASHYHNSPDQLPFDFPEVLAAIAPRAIFIVAPMRDNNFSASGARDCVSAARKVYDLLGHSKRLQAEYPDAAHDFPTTQRQQAYAFFDKELAPQGPKRQPFTD